jgi:DNA-binding transcriptional MerR regulator
MQARRQGDMHAAMESGDEGAVYNIGTAARKSGLSVTTIRTWEDRYGAVVPVRDASGRRLYSAEQIAQLTWLRQQVDAGLRASEAHRLLIAGETDTQPGTGVVVDRGSAWATLLGWAEQERGWIGSILGDLRRGLRAKATILAIVIDNPLRGQVLSALLHEAENGDTDLRDIGILPLDGVPDLAPLLEEGEPATAKGSDLGVDVEKVTFAPLSMGAKVAGAVMAVDPQAEDPEALVERAVRVIESRIEADRARSAFSSLLD